MVYHARDRKSGSEVAVKVLIKDRLGDRFAQEAQKLSQLSHPNLVRFFEFGNYQGRDYIVMEYLPGGDLAHYVAGRTVEQILKIFVPICTGLGYLHSQGIVHRDVKPANILLDEHGVPKLTDLGSARQIDRKTRITKAGAILGTYAYLAPEQIQSGDAGPAADLYSLGVCLFEALTGRRPFTIKNEFKLMKAHLEEPPPALSKLRPDLPESVDRLVASLLEKKAENRPTTAEVVAAMLERCRSHLKEQAQQPGESFNPDQAIESLSEAQRSVLLAVAYLGERATFSQVCAISAFAEDRTDALLDGLIQARLLSCHQRDTFELNFPRKIVLARITPRVRDLFEARLSSVGAAAPHSSGMTTVALTESGSTETPEPSRLPTAEVATRPKLRILKRGLFSTALIAAVLLMVGWSRSAELIVASMPEQANVIVDGQWKGKTPLRLRAIRPGKHAVRVVMDGHLSEVREVELVPFQPLPIDITLKESRGRLGLEQVPPGAQVTINGAVYDPKDLSDISLSAGKTRLKVVHDGFRPFIQEIELRAGEMTTLKVELSPIQGQLVCITVPAGAQVSLDGRPVGTTPVTLDSLTFGTHTIEFKKSGFAPHSQSVEVNEEAPKEVKVELKAISGDLEVESDPPGAEIFLEGESRGVAPLSLSELPEGKLRLVGKLAGYKDASQPVAVVAGRLSKVRLKLSPTASPKASSSPNTALTPKATASPTPR